jgi:cysteine-rich repeat protein
VKLNSAYCGDSRVQRPNDNGQKESCDDGNLENTDMCRNDCTDPVCGDGYVQYGEECDDGNTDNYDCCNASCQREDYVSPEEIVVSDMIEAMQALSDEEEEREVNNCFEDCADL